VTEVKAMPVLIQSEGSGLTIEGTEAGTPIRVYDLSGRLIGNTTAAEGATKVECSACSEKLVIVKVGERSVKVVVR
jgi:YD repeat-containing protein